MYRSHRNYVVNCRLAISREKSSVKAYDSIKSGKHILLIFKHAEVVGGVLTVAGFLVLLLYYHLFGKLCGQIACLMCRLQLAGPSPFSGLGQMRVWSPHVQWHECVIA